MKTRLLIIIGLIIAIIISVSALIIIDNIESQTSNSHLQSILDSCYAQKNNLIHTQEHRSISNDTHFINNRNCEWGMIEQEKWVDKRSLFIHSHGLHNLTPPDTHPINSWYNNQMSDTDLQTVIDSCANDSPKERMKNSLRYTNETHVFMNLGCEWKKIGIFVGEKENEN